MKLRWFNVTILLSGGGKVKFNCHSIEVNKLSQKNREINVNRASIQWTVDLDKVEAVTITKRWFYFLSVFATL